MSENASAHGPRLRAPAPDQTHLQQDHRSRTGDRLPSWQRLPESTTPHLQGSPCPVKGLTTAEASWELNTQQHHPFLGGSREAQNPSWSPHCSHREFPKCSDSLWHSSLLATTSQVAQNSLRADALKCPIKPRGSSLPHKPTFYAKEHKFYY